MAEHPISAATRRAAAYSPDPQWFCDFREEEISGLVPEPGVHRRDPSSILKIDGVYHVWYTKSVGDAVGFGTGDPMAKVFPWDWSEVWHATSSDGQHWTEADRAVGLGDTGAYDDRSVFTPEVLAHGGRYYLVYQVLQSPYRLRSFESIAMASADDPSGPWTKTPEPLLTPAANGEWAGDEDDRLAVRSQGDFDSHKVHDPLLLPLNGRFYLYYKGEQMGERFTSGGRSTKWGVATADRIDGPYTRSPLNPITNSGHETCLWLHADGVAAMLTTDGPERNTLQYAADGENFEIQAYIPNPPVAAGPLRTGEPTTVPLDGLRWGLCHDVTGEWGYLKMFHVDESQKLKYELGVSPEKGDDAFRARLAAHEAERV
ncbi:glycoside hydrolase family 117 protein [Microbacterium sp. R86528]|uniref:glycoside hydrolase family 117 protein n=1 Tax=Microbacterium sp. R86528 TaxID=3093864 RepID=UPI0037CA94B3